MGTGEWMIVFWTVVNMVVPLVILVALILGVVYVIRLSRRVRRIEDRLNRKDE